MSAERRQAPEWVRRVAAFRAEVIAALPEAEREAIAARVAAARARRAERLARARLVVRLFHGGASDAEIAALVGMTPASVRNFARRHCGLSIPRGGARRRLVAVGAEAGAALAYLAVDAGRPPAPMLDALVAAFLADDAALARRALGVRRRKTA